MFFFILFGQFRVARFLYSDTINSVHEDVNDPVTKCNLDPLAGVRFWDPSKSGGFRHVQILFKLLGSYGP